MEIEKRLEAMGLALPAAMQSIPDVPLPFVNVRVWEGRAYIAGHVATNADGSVSEVRGKVGAEISVEQGYE